MKQEFLQQCQTYNPKKHSISGWFCSEKLDGVRAFWDGGITRDVPKNKVPWANLEKDNRYLKAPVATGLWTRYGNVIHAPSWWLDKLPNYALDGELYIGRNSFQQLVRIIKTLQPSSEWSKVSYMVFDAPPLETIFCERKIDLTNFEKTIRRDTIAWINARGGRSLGSVATVFKSINIMLREALAQNETVLQHKQVQLSFGTPQAISEMELLITEIVDAGGEGVILRAPFATYETVRSHNVLKYKPFQDCEATVIGYIAGQGKLEGLIGAVIVRLDNGKELELSGFTDQERQTMQPIDVAPGIILPDSAEGKYIKKGSVVTIKYRELTEDGIPKEARYWR